MAPTLPMPGVSFTLLTALRRQGGAGGGEVCRTPLKLVAKRGASAADGVEGRCFFFLDDRFNFWAALHGDNKEEMMRQSEVWDWLLLSFLLKIPLIISSVFILSTLLHRELN